MYAWADREGAARGAWKRRRRRARAPKARVESSAVGARIEAPRGRVCRKVVPFSTGGGSGKGAVPPSEKFSICEL